MGVEYDSERWHGPERWQADEARHQAIEAAGWTLVRADKLDLRPGRPQLRESLDRVWPNAAMISRGERTNHRRTATSALTSPVGGGDPQVGMTRLGLTVPSRNGW